MKSFLPQRYLPVAATLVVLALLYGVAACRYDHFFSVRVAVDLLRNNSFLGLAAVGLTFVILSGGIDLSVGSVVAFATIFTAWQIERQHVPPLLAMLASVALGTLVGLLQGALIQAYQIPPFLVTLAGLFFVRGAAFWVSAESIGIHHPLYDELQSRGLPLGGGVQLPVTALVFLGVFATAWLVAQQTRFGRNVYALGGNEQSALLMGLPVARTRLSVYALSGFCAAVAGIVLTLHLGSGDPAKARGLELDAIAATVIGGTMLTGGRGYLVGTLLGVLVLGVIETGIQFDGRLGSAWVRLVVGGLLLLFILLQRALVSRRAAAPPPRAR